MTGLCLLHPLATFRAGPSDRRAKADGRTVVTAPENGAGATPVIRGLATLRVVFSNF